MGRIVVGIDGSPESKRALRWAADEARLRDADLQVVYAYGPPEEYNPYALAYGVDAGSPDLAADEREWQERHDARAHERAEAVVHGVVREVMPADDEVRTESIAVRDTRPARALMHSARGADLLVVGSRGRGGFAGLLLGSISQQCAHHAPCPVVVVRAVD